MDPQYCLNSFVSSSTNGQSILFYLHDEQTVNGLGQSSGLPFSVWLCLHGHSMFPCFHVYVSISMYPCFHVSMFPEFRKRMALKKKMVKSVSLLTNGKWKRQTSVCLLQRETENEILFSLIGKQLTVSTISVSSNLSIYS
jgi:hypothetical protein